MYWGDLQRFRPENELSSDHDISKTDLLNELLYKKTVFVSGSIFITCVEQVYLWFRSFPGNLIVCIGTGSNDQVTYNISWKQKIVTDLLIVSANSNHYSH